MNDDLNFNNYSMKTYFKSLFFALAIAVLTSAGLNAQKVNLTGDYVLNRSQSILGVEFSMPPQTVKIVHDGNTVTIDRVTDMMGQVANTSEKFITDGSECVNPYIMGMSKKSKALWNEEGISLWIISTMDMQGELVNMTEVFYINENGQLRIDSSASTSMGGISENYILDKQ